MQSSRDNDSKKNDDQSGSSISAWLFYKIISFIQYSFEIISSEEQQLQSSFGSGRSDGVIKYPIDSLHVAYNGPSVLHVPDSKFNQTHDLIGWTTDRHPTGIFSDKEGCLHHVKSSFNLDDVSDDEKEKLLQRRNSFYKSAYSKDNINGYCNILSHRSCMGEMQSTFGFYGAPSIETLKFIHGGYQKRGFIIGIRAFGNKDYYCSVNDKTYQLAKIDLNTIDLDKIHKEHNGSLNKIAHVYLRNNTVQQHPDTDDLKNTFCRNGSLGFYENYIKNLPNFSDTVDWVIPSSDLPSALQGNPVINMMDNKEINILQWQNKQQKKSQKPLEKYSIFALPRPSDYDNSYEPDEINGQLKPPILFKIGKK